MDRSNPLRLLAEVLCIVALAEGGVMFILPIIAPNASTFNGAFLDVGMVLVLSSPLVYWRLSAALQRVGHIFLIRRELTDAGRPVMWLVASIQVLGLIITATAVWWESNSLDTAAKNLFDQGTNRIQAEVVRRFNLTLTGLKGARGAMVSNPSFNSDAFRLYVQSRNLPLEFPGVRGVGLIEHVQRNGLDRFVARRRSEGVPQFQVRSSGNAEDLFVVRYLEPQAPNQVALGFDLGQDPIRRNAVTYAIDTGEATLLSGITLLQDAKQSQGLLFFLPVYRNGTNPQSISERRRDLIGVLYSPIVASELLGPVASVTDRLIDFELFSGTESTADKLIFDADGILSTLRSANFRTRHFATERIFEVGSTVLTLRASSTERFEAAQDRSSLIIIGAGGAIISLLIAVSVGLLASGRQRALALATAMTAELDRMAQVVQHTDNAVTIMDRDMRIQWVNKGFTQITGYSLEEANGKTPTELLSSGKSDQTALTALMEGAERETPCRVELINLAKGGREYWADTEVQPMHDKQGALVGFMEIGTDVTKQKQVQRKLEAAMMEARALLDTVEIHAIVSITDGFGLITEVNDAFCAISGYGRDELIGRNHSVINSGVHSSAFWQEFWDTIRGGKPWHGEICNRAKDGTLYWVDSMIAPFVGVDGTIEKYISIRTDITERKQYEQSLQEARDKAEIATRSKAQFLANMSHEIRTPMNAILGMLNLLQKTTLNQRQLDYAEKTEAAAKSLLGLINDILDFSKAEAGKMTLDPQPMSIEKMLRNVSVILSGNLGAKPVQILFDIDPTIHDMVMGDGMRLQQVLINLGGNAVKFTEQGEVIVSVHQTALHDGVATLEFAVRDTGIGIAPENQARIFTGFSQAEASTTRKFGGTGLGLAISQRFVELMGGTLNLQSTLGQGSVFSFQLALPVLDGVPHVAASSKDVLVVDANPTARAIAAAAVRAYGWPVEVAEDGESALTAISARLENPAADAEVFDVVFMDWHLPGMDGWQTIARLRELYSKAGCAQPTIVMVATNRRDALDQRTAQEQRLINGFLVKPVTPGMMRDAALHGTMNSVAIAVQNETASSQRRLAGMQVLVVEDNLLNQQIADELLSAEGATVMLAANGQLGVDAIAVAAGNRQFDAVLMDIQMPVMDGYAATRHVRQILQLKDLPIIAMTANAMPSDRDECLAAGMNEHVGKPFDLDHLVQTLLNVCGHASMSAQVSVQAKEPATALLDVTAALKRMGGSTSVYIPAARDFWKTLPTQVNALAQQANTDIEVPQSMAALAHTLKGLSATLGAAALAKVAASVEVLVKANAPGQELASAIAELKRTAQETQDALGAALESLPDAGRSVVGTETLLSHGSFTAKAALVKLEHLLESNNLEALAHYAAIQGMLEHVPQIDRDELDEALQRLDLEAALRVCREIQSA